MDARAVIVRNPNDKAAPECKGDAKGHPERLHVYTVIHVRDLPPEIGSKLSRCFRAGALMRGERVENRQEAGGTCPAEGGSREKPLLAPRLRPFWRLLGIIYRAEDRKPARAELEAVAVKSPKTSMRHGQNPAFRPCIGSDRAGRGRHLWTRPARTQKCVLPAWHQNARLLFDLGKKSILSS